MRKKLLHLAIFVFLGAIWLFPYRSTVPGNWGSVAVLAAAEACMCLLPQGWATVAVSFLAAPALYILGAEYFAAYAAGIFVCAAFRAAAAGKKNLPLRRDVLVILPLAAAAAAVAFSMYSVFSARSDFSFRMADSTVRHLVYTGVSAAFTAVLLAVAVSLKKGGARSGKTADHTAGKLAVVLGVMLAVYAAVVLVYLKQQINSSLLLAAFLCIYTAVTVPNPAADRLLNRSVS